MPRMTPAIHFGNIAAYRRARKGSGLSRKELLAEQDVMELKLAKKAAARGVKLMGAVQAARRKAIEAARRKAAERGSAAAVSVKVAFSSRGRPLRERKLWPDDDDD